MDPEMLPKRIEIVDEHTLQRHGRVHDEVGKDGPPVQEHVTDQPEHRTGQSPEFTGEDRLARVQRVTANLNVVQGLNENADGGNPQQCGSVLGGNRGSGQPLPATDRGRSHNQSGTKHREPIPAREDRGVDQVS